MNRDALIRELQRIAKDKKRAFEVVRNQGTGSHYRVRLGDRRTTLKSDELSPTYVKLVKKQLGLI